MLQIKNPRKSLAWTEKSSAKAHILRPHINNSLGTGGAAQWNSSGKNFTLMLSSSVPKKQAHNAGISGTSSISLSLSVSQTVSKTSQLYCK